MAGAEVDLLDLIEVFAGKATVTDLAQHYGLSALQPFDLIYGQDLADPGTAEVFRQTVRRFKPLLTLIAWNCTEHSLFNENMNYSHRMDELHARRDEQRPTGCPWQ